MKSVAEFVSTLEVDQDHITDHNPFDVGSEYSNDSVPSDQGQQQSGKLAVKPCPDIPDLELLWPEVLAD